MKIKLANQFKNLTLIFKSHSRGLDIAQYNSNIHQYNSNTKIPNINSKIVLEITSKLKTFIISF